MTGADHGDPCSPAARFNRACAHVCARLPLGLSAVVAPTMLGFAVLNVCTFAVDVLLLTILHGGLGMALPIALTAAYGCALALSFVLNRTLNFDSRGSVPSQLTVYVAVVATNYAVFILMLSSVLSAAGVDYRCARIAAGACEAIFMYAAMRWLVFR